MEVKSDNVNDIIGVKKEEEEKEEKINVNNNETKINNNNDSSPNTDGTERRVKETEDKPPLNPIHIDDFQAILQQNHENPIRIDDFQAILQQKS